MSTAIPILSFLVMLNLATTSWTFKSEFDILDGCRWLSSVASERRLIPMPEELRAAVPYSASPVKDRETLQALSLQEQEALELLKLLKPLCGWPLDAQAEEQGNGVYRQAFGGGVSGVASRLVKLRRGPSGFEFLNVLRKRKPSNSKSAPTELDPTFMLMGIGRK